MNRRSLGFCRLIVWTAAIAFLAAPVAADERPTGPLITARMLLDRTALTPGDEAWLAVEVQIIPNWHIYHPLLLDTGLPTRIEFAAPENVEIGAVQFPIPTFGKSFEAEYLAYHDRVVFLAPVHVAPGAAPDVEIGATVHALVCHDDFGCIPARAEAKLSVAVQPTSEPANAELFAAARRNLPNPLDQANHLQGSRAVSSHAKIPVGGQAEVGVLLQVAPDHHILDPKPGVEGLIPTRVFVERLDGLVFEPAQWPAAKKVEIEGVGKINEHQGSVLVRVPFRIEDRKFELGPRRLRVLVEYQVCSESGQCYPPTMAEAFVEFEAAHAGAPAVASGDEMFALAQRAADAGGLSDHSVWNLLLVFLGAFVGGVILNVMPCVLPVISLKILGFVQQAGQSRSHVLRLGLAYAAGIMASFAALAAVMVSFRLAWGGLMQQPGFVIALTGVVFAFALSLLGVWEVRLPGRVEMAAGAASRTEGAAGAFFNGILATLLATPCTAPFLGSALGVIVTLSAWVAGAGILTVGLGLAAPYVLLTAFPQWLRFLPKPGAWMVTFKEVMGFVLLATVLWLLYVLMTLTSQIELFATLVFLALIGLACWMVGRLTLSSSTPRMVATWSCAVALCAIGWAGPAILTSDDGPSIEWRDWQPGLAERLAREGHTVYVDYTASWCLTCQVNKKLVLETGQVSRKFADLGVVALKADFTRYDPQIQRELNQHGRNGVPLNIVLPSGRPAEPIVLPELLTTSRVLEALESAGPSRSDGAEIGLAAKPS